MTYGHEERYREKCISEMPDDVVLEGLRLMADLCASGWNPGDLAGEAARRLRPGHDRTLFWALNHTAGNPQVSEPYDAEVHRTLRMQVIVDAIAAVEARAERKLVSEGEFRSLLLDYKY